MLKISDALEEIIEDNNLLAFGLQHRLFNLSQLSKFLQPLVETRTKKSITESALLMSLSRFQRDFKKEIWNIQDFIILNITVNSGLASMTFSASPGVLKNISKLYRAARSKKDYITLSQGTSEITLIASQELLDLAKSVLGESPIFVKKGLSSVGLKFSLKYNDMPGFFYHVLQKVALQGISVHEVSSTYSELILYIEEEKIRLAFDTLYNCLPVRRG